MRIVLKPHAARLSDRFERVEKLRIFFTYRVSPRRGSPHLQASDLVGEFRCKSDVALRRQFQQALAFRVRDFERSDEGL